MNELKPQVGAPVPVMRWESVSDGETVVFGEPKERWTILFVYRGRHCPRCKKFLNKLNSGLSDWQEVLDVVVVSADPLEKAQQDKDEFGWNFDLCWGLAETDMRALGLYVSSPLSEAETDRNFAEPGAFAIKPDGTLMLVDISNGPAARPDLEELLDGLKFNITNDRPTRGLA